MNTAFRLALTDDAFQTEVDYVCTRLDQLQAERSSEWTTRRERYERFAAGDFVDRLNDLTLPGIFRIEGCNQTLGIIRSVNTFLEARIVRDLFGSEPFFDAHAQGTMAKPLAAQIQPHFAWKLHEAGFEVQAKMIVRKVLDLGECPVKVTWRVEEDTYEVLGNVLHDRTTGEPVVGNDGSAILDSDPADGEEDGVPQISQMGADAGAGGGDAGGGGMSDFGSSNVGNKSDISSVGVGGAGDEDEDEEGEEEGSAAPIVKGVQLNRDLHEWRAVPVTKTDRIYAGLDVHPCDWRDVLYPANCPDLERADMVAHRFDMVWSDLKAKYNPGTPETNPDFSQEIEDALNKVKHGGAAPESAESRADIPRGETQANAPDAALDPIVHCAEIYYDHVVSGGLAPLLSPSAGTGTEGTAGGDEDEGRGTKVEGGGNGSIGLGGGGAGVSDGVKRRLFMVVVPKARVALTADYRAAVCPRGQKAIKMVSIRRRMNRADGVGNYENFESAMRNADMWLNLTQYQAELVTDPPTVFNPHRCVDGTGNKNLKIRPGLLVQAADRQTSPSDIYAPIPVPDKLDRAWQFMQFWMQLVQAESGVTNAAQAAVSSLPGNDLATGINALAEVASILHLHLLGQVKDGFESALSYACELTYKNQDRDETYEYLEGNASQVLALSDAQQLAQLPMKVEISLTRAKRQQDREAATAAIPLGAQFGQMAPMDQERMKPVFEQAFEGLGFEDVETLFPTDEEIAQRVAQQLQAQGWTVTPPGAANDGAPPPVLPTEAITIGYQYLEPVVKAQVLARIGINVSAADLGPAQAAPGAGGGNPQISRMGADAGNGSSGGTKIEPGQAPQAGTVTPASGPPGQ